jgi:carboxymethylenebutenolidase
MKCPVLGFFGGQDGMVGPGVVAKLKAALDAAGVDAEFHTYPDAGHAFFNDVRPEAYVEHAAEDSWTRALAFLRMHLTD